MEDNYDKKILKRIEKFSPSRSLMYEAFEKIPSKQRVDPFTPYGTRVLVAKYPDFYKLFLIRYHEEGEPSYPYGGVEVWNANDDCRCAFYYDAVSIHPIEYIAKIREIHDKAGNVVDWMLAESIPITKSDEREVKKLENREKKMEKMAKREAKLAVKEEKRRLKEAKKHKKLVKMREIEDRLRRKESAREAVSKKLAEFMGEDIPENKPAKLVKKFIKGKKVKKK
jgi:hypothetical protein